MSTNKEKRNSPDFDEGFAKGKQAATEPAQQEIAELKKQLAAEQALRVFMEGAADAMLEEVRLGVLTLSTAATLRRALLQTSPHAALDAAIAEAEKLGYDKGVHFVIHNT